MWPPRVAAPLLGHELGAHHLPRYPLPCTRTPVRPVGLSRARRGRLGERRVDAHGLVQVVPGRDLSARKLRAKARDPEARAQLRTGPGDTSAASAAGGKLSITAGQGSSTTGGQGGTLEVASGVGAKVTGGNLLVVSGGGTDTTSGAVTIKSANAGDTLTTLSVSRFPPRPRSHHTQS